MNFIRNVLVCLFLTGLLAGCATTGGGSTGAAADYRNGVLTDKNGMTVYTYLKDSYLKSVCNDACAAPWLPLKAGPGDHGGGDFAIVKRDDGSLQWAFEGKPLYLWTKDTKPGDKTGQGVANAWSTVIEPPTRKVVSDY